MGALISYKSDEKRPSNVEMNKFRAVSTQPIMGIVLFFYNSQDLKQHFTSEVNAVFS